MRESPDGAIEHAAHIAASRTTCSLIVLVPIVIPAVLLGWPALFFDDRGVCKLWVEVWYAFQFHL